MASPDWPAYYPKYQPFPRTIRRGMRPVPNQQSVDWPQAQFAPLYLPPGSPSFQPYSYKKNDVPYSAQTPCYMTGNCGNPYRQSGVGPDGDIAQLPSGYGDSSMQPIDREPLPAKRLRRLARLILAFSRRKNTRNNKKAYSKMRDEYRVLKVEMVPGFDGKGLANLLRQARVLAHEIDDLEAKKGSTYKGKINIKRRKAKEFREKALTIEVRARKKALSLAAQPPVRRMGPIVTGQGIAQGAPIASAAPSGAKMQAVGATAANQTPTGYLGTFGNSFGTPVVRKGARPAGYGNYGDGMAYELAPVTAMQTYSESVLGGDDECYSCGASARRNSALAIGAGGVGLGGALTMGALTFAMLKMTNTI